MAVTLDRAADWSNRSRDAAGVRDWTRDLRGTGTPRLLPRRLSVREPPVRTARFRGAVVRNHGRLPTRLDQREKRAASRDRRDSLFSHDGDGRDSASAIATPASRADLPVLDLMTRYATILLRIAPICCVDRDVSRERVTLC